MFESTGPKGQIATILRRIAEPKWPVKAPKRTSDTKTTAKMASTTESRANAHTSAPDIGHPFHT